MIDVETLVRRHDPARTADIPEVDSPMGRQVRSRVRPPGDGPSPLSRSRLPLRPVAARPRRARTVALGSLAVAALVVALVLALLPGTAPPDSAAAVLDKLADQAGQLPSTLRPGQYVYTETRDPGLSVGDTLRTGQAVHYYLVRTTQTWVAADGSGRRVATIDPTPRFWTAADRAAWVAAGKPTLVVPPGMYPVVESFAPGGTPEVQLGPTGKPVVNLGSQPPLYDVGGLPTDVATLAVDVATGHGVPAVHPGTQTGACPGGTGTVDCTTFQRAAALLQGPDVGATPALRSALFQVLAGVPGVRNLGTVTDRSGRRGIGLELFDHRPAGHLTVGCDQDGPGGSSPTVTVPYPAYTVTYEIVVDPATTTVLATEADLTGGPFGRLAGVCSGQAAPTPATRGGAGPVWTTVLATGVVDSETALPAGVSASSTTTTS